MAETTVLEQIEAIKNADTWTFKELLGFIDEHIKGKLLNDKGEVSDVSSRFIINYGLSDSIKEILIKEDPVLYIIYKRALEAFREKFKCCGECYSYFKIDIHNITRPDYWFSDEIMNFITSDNYYNTIEDARDAAKKFIETNNKIKDNELFVVSIEEVICRAVANISSELRQYHVG